MSVSDRAKLKPDIELFYTQNNTKMKKNMIPLNNFMTSYSIEGQFIQKLDIINLYGYDFKNV